MGRTALLAAADLIREHRRYGASGGPLADYLDRLEAALVDTGWIAPAGKAEPGRRRTTSTFRGLPVVVDADVPPGEFRIRESRAHLGSDLFYELFGPKIGQEREVALETDLAPMPAEEETS